LWPQARQVILTLPGARNAFWKFVRVAQDGQVTIIALKTAFDSTCRVRNVADRDPSIQNG
jgi:hypothetical protein